uniref:Uncharacterized protein n=1 Tax=Anguilla anguilla TaxID=7936 RepID=A0A0E9VM61_ANGAN
MQKERPKNPKSLKTSPLWGLADLTAANKN